MQDIRGSQTVGGKFDKNDFIFAEDWDFIIIDEAHEGTQTELGQRVIETIKNNENKNVKLLELSGTPFNLISDFKDDEIYTWDYVMEQKAKRDWPLTHFGDSNPYEELPTLQIFTYDIKKHYPIKEYIDDDSAFNFKEFFRTWTGNTQKDYKVMPLDAKKGDFVHKEDVFAFLNLLTKKDEETNYPFSKEEYRNYYRHTLWIVPGVKEAKALSEMLKQHDCFKNFNIVNVAGDGDEDAEYKNDLSGVRSAISDEPDKTYSITISCGRLTTGVTVPEWTAVFYLAGSFNTSASNYLQTIFRVQSPANINGKIKEKCAVFDFAPDRTLKMVCETCDFSAKAKKSNDKKIIGEFLNYCPIIAVNGSSMEPYNSDKLVQELKKVYTDKVVKNGFDDIHLYNKNNLLELNEIELSDFEKLKQILKATNQSKKNNDIELNNQGFTNEEYEKVESIANKTKKELTPEEQELLEKYKQQKENAKKAISILRAISIRIPLLIYGADVNDNDDEITVNNFVDKIDDESWKEFMPADVDKKLYKKFTKYYDEDVFTAAGKQIREMTKLADDLSPTERVMKIASIFARFKNPDRETVLTPWNVINIHLGTTLGGYNFYDENYENKLDEPRFIDLKPTKETLTKIDAKILDINSKTGLYSLYVAYSIYMTKLNKIPKDEQTVEKQKELWDETVKNNIYAICKTDMAKYITKRTLTGYSNLKINVHAFKDLVSQLKNKDMKFKEKVLKANFWKKEGEDMKFDAIVGNPPYQNGHQQIYVYFYLTSIELTNNYVTLIFPCSWQQPKTANGLDKLNTLEIKTDKQIVFIDNRQNIFQGITGAEWVNIILWQKGYDNKLDGLQNIYTNGSDLQYKKLIWDQNDVYKPIELKNAFNLVKEKGNFTPVQEITSSRNPYGLSFKKEELITFMRERESMIVTSLYMHKKELNDMKEIHLI